MNEARQNLNDFPYSDTAAAVMLAGAIHRMKQVRGISLRSVAKMLNYKQATVLSHMANGRVVVPLDRAEEIARVLEMDPVEFVIAAVQQRSQSAGALLAGVDGIAAQSGETFVSELQLIAGQSMDGLNDEQRQVAREVVADDKPQRRWLTLAELPVMHMLRQLRPEISAKGLSSEDRAAIIHALRS